MKFIVSGLITDKVTLAGTNIDLTKTLTANQHPVLIGIGCDVSNSGDVDFTANSDFRITAFRVRPNLPGVVATNDVAAELQLKFATLDSGVAGDTLLGCKIRAAKMNEWTPTNIFISKEALQGAYDLTGKPLRPFTLFIVAGYVYVMDYNLQEDFVGQDVQFSLELEIEADNLIDSVAGTLVG